MKYEEFLERKKTFDVPTGLSSIPELNKHMMPFQHDITAWALRRGRACIFADCGMGKTLMQLEWARQVPGDVIIFAPLAVAEQTIREGVKFGINGIEYSDDGTKRGKITITNYERIDKFNPSDYTGIVLDESSILKSYTGKYRNDLVDNWKLQYRLACTATPAPNDFMELGNHAEFVGAMTRTEMLAMFFVHDGGETSKWRLKGHAESEFWKWVCSWAVMIRNPSDFGYEDGDYILPKLNIEQVTVESVTPSEGFLFAMEAQTLQERQGARRASIDARVKAAVDIVNRDKESQWMIWCDLNDESAAIKKAIEGSIEVRGSDTEKHKRDSLLNFSRGEISCLVSKPSIAGWGMNFQSCHNTIFVGLSDSYEQFYQAVRRHWRFGQKHTVNCYIVTADTEGAVVQNIMRKEEDAKKMADEMVLHMHSINEENIRGTSRTKTGYDPEIEMKIPEWIRSK